MNKLNLYPFCDKWLEKGGSIWIFSDPHFNDPDNKIFNPNAPSTEELIKKINSKCGKNDTLICLGDVGDLECIKKLRAGYKVLIKGNHDQVKFEGEDSDNKVFDEIYDGPVCIRKDIILSHEEVEFKYAFNIHGHDHKGDKLINTMFKLYDSDLNSKDYIKAQLDSIKEFNLKDMNCCFEWLGYNLLNLKDFINSGILKDITDIHKEYIDLVKKRKN